MSAPDDDNDDDVLQAYRRASAQEAGRPSEATRAAILAEARRVAARHERRAANEPWFSWRLAAGLAVIGVALIVWRQLPRDPTAPFEAPRAPVPAPLPDAPTPPATELSETVTVAPPNGGGDGAPAPPPPAPAMATSSAPAPKPVIIDLGVRQAVPESAADAPAGLDAQRRESATRSAALAPVTPSRRIDLADRVLREFGPVLQAPSPPPGVWMVIDASGRTLRKGTLTRGEALGAVLTRVQRELPDQRVQPFQMTTLQTAQGEALLVGLARAE